MDFEKFTDRAKKVIVKAQNFALANSNQQFSSLHILKSLLEEQDGLSLRLLQSCEGNIEKIISATKNAIDTLPKVETSSAADQFYITPETAKVLEEAASIAKTMNDQFISCEILLLAMIKQADSAAGKVLKLGGISKDTLTKAITELRKGQNVSSSSAEE